MKKQLSVIVLGLAVCVSAATDRYQSNDDGFSVIFPGDVTRKEEKVKFEGGEAASRTYRCSQGQSVYQISVTPLPRETLRNRPIQEILDMARDGAVKSQRGTQAESETKLLVNGAPARRFIIQPSNAPVAVHLMIVANGRLYHVLSSLPTRLQNEGEEFVKSFSLTSVISTGD